MSVKIGGTIPLKFTGEAIDVAVDSGAVICIRGLSIPALGVPTVPVCLYPQEARKLAKYLNEAVDETEK